METDYQLSDDIKPARNNMSRSPDNANGTERTPLSVADISDSLLPEDYAAHDAQPDNANGADRTQISVADISDSLLPEDYAAHDTLSPLPVLGEVPGPPGHRRAQSLFSTIPTGGSQRRGRHHRKRSSIGQFMETIGEGVRGEGTMVRDAWREELAEGNEGKRYFLDMNLTRSLSILPEDIQEFSEEAVGRPSIHRPPDGDEAPAPITATTKVASLGSYLALLSAVFAVSSNGTALALLHDVPPCLKLFWRMTAVAALLSFFAIKTMYKQYQEEGRFFPKLTLSQWFTFFSAAICFFLHTLLLFTAFTLTSIGNAVIGSNSQALLLVIGKLFTGQTVVWLEGLGVLTAFAGCILCTTDEVVEEDDGDADEDENYKALLGDLLALGSAVTGVFYLTFAKAVRSHVPVTVFMFMVMLSGCILSFTYIFATGMEVTWDNDPHTGLFGWMTLEENHIFVILHVALVCNMIGTMGFVRAMEYFDNIIIAVATLLEPMIATLIAFALGVGDLPGTMGWIGNLLVALGTLGVVYPSINDPSAGGGH